MDEKYNAEFNAEMRRRGVFRPGENLSMAIERTCKRLIDLDAQMEGLLDEKFASALVDLIDQKFIGFSTAILSNAGEKSLPVASCTVSSLRTNQGGEVDLEDFYASSKVLFESCIGVGFDLTPLSSLSGVVKNLNDCLGRINLPLLAEQRRPVAAMMTLDWRDSKLSEFLGEIARPNQNLLATYSIYLSEDAFLDLQFGVDWINVFDSKPSAALSPGRRVIRMIAESILRTGNPGVLFRDRFDSDNPTPEFSYLSTAPCAEVGMAPGDACHFGYVNLYALARNGRFDWAGLRSCVRILTRSLDAAVEHSIQASSGLSLVAQRRRIGVCLTGLADCFDALGIDYDSSEAEQLARRVSEVIDYESKYESVCLAERRGPFPAWKNSRYRDRNWVSRKFKRHVPSEIGWSELVSRMADKGIRNASTTSLSSAETASAFFSVSTSLEPDRFPSLLSSDLAISPVKHWHKQPRKVSPISQLRVQAAIQCYLDDAVSKTITLTADSSVKDVEHVLYLAWQLDLRGVSIFVERN